MLSKGDIMINPETSRPVKVGSRTWLKLVKRGVIEGAYKDPKDLYTIKDTDDAKSMNEMKIKLNEDLPEHEHVVHGRGKYKNKLVKRSKPLTRKTVEEYTKKQMNKISKPVEINDEPHYDYDELNVDDDVDDVPPMPKLRRQKGRRIEKLKPRNPSFEGNRVALHQREEKLQYDDEELNAMLERLINEEMNPRSRAVVNVSSDDADTFVQFDGPESYSDQDEYYYSD